VNGEKKRPNMSTDYSPGKEFNNWGGPCLSGGDCPSVVRKSSLPLGDKKKGVLTIISSSGGGKKATGESPKSTHLETMVTHATTRNHSQAYLLLSRELLNNRCISNTGQGGLFSDDPPEHRDQNYQTCVTQTPYSRTYVCGEYFQQI